MRQITEKQKQSVREYVLAAKDKHNWRLSNGLLYHYNVKRENDDKRGCIATNNLGEIHCIPWAVWRELPMPSVYQILLYQRTGELC